MGGLRNLCNYDRLRRELAVTPAELATRAERHGLNLVIARAERLADALFVRRLLARAGWGRARRPGTRLASTLREHGMRMPPLTLARHLLRKATLRD